MYSLKCLVCFHNPHGSSPWDPFPFEVNGAAVIAHWMEQTVLSSLATAIKLSILLGHTPTLAGLWGISFGYVLGTTKAR